MLGMFLRILACLQPMGQLTSLPVQPRLPWPKQEPQELSPWPAKPMEEGTPPENLKIAGALRAINVGKVISLLTLMLWRTLSLKGLRACTGHADSGLHRADHRMICLAHGCVLKQRGVWPLAPSALHRVY
jgi:hypothetical protein